jgi:spectinomycin phosphotransferase
MLERPDIQDEIIVACVRDAYGLTLTGVVFLPLGADRDTAVYRGIAGDGTGYFLKLRGGSFDPTTVAVPKLLHDQGIAQVIAPILTQSGGLWADLGAFKLTVSPFVEGRDGYAVRMADRHWREFGRALKGIHTALLPPAITQQIQREDYTPRFREHVKRFLVMAQETDFPDPVAARLAELLQREDALIGNLVRRAEALASVMQAQSQPFVLCHADIHAGNVFIDSAGRFYIVDWDTLILAPKARDLMYVGGGQFCNDRTPDEEERLFYQGYGPTDPDPVGLAYYRYERIVQDIAAYCEQILLTDGGGADQENGLRQLQSQFRPGEVVEMARRSEQFLPDALRAD